MAIQFARVERVGRSSGGNACCKGAYNSRSKITDQITGVVYNFNKRGGNVYHEVMLPDHVEKKFKNTSILMNEIEASEKRKDSQLVKEFLLALPDESNVSLSVKKEMVYAFIKENRFIEEGLGVQIDIHEPHEDEKNWHAHLLVTTRRFREDGKGFSPKKAVDLEPRVLQGSSKAFACSNEEINIGEQWKDIQNTIFKKYGLSNRVDEIGKIAQEHIGPRRMRSILNQKVFRNEEKKEAEIKYLNSGDRVIEKITTHMSVFNKNDIKRVLKIHENKDIREDLFQQVIASKEIVELFESEVSAEPGSQLKHTGFYTTKTVRAEEDKLLRLGNYIAQSKSVFAGKEARVTKILGEIKSANKEALARGDKGFNEEQIAALEYMLSSDSGLKILRGRAGTGKSHVFGELARVCGAAGVNIVGLAPTHKARGELASRNFSQNDTVKGMLFKIKNGRFVLPKGSLIVVDEAGMIANTDLREVLRVASGYKCSVIMGGDERQLSSPSRGGMFEVFSEKFTSCIMSQIRRQETSWGREVASRLSEGDVRGGLKILEQEGKISQHDSKSESMQTLLADWHASTEDLDSKMIITVKNSDVDLLNKGARQYLKESGVLTGPEFDIKGKSYCKGDRLLIIQTDKKLGLTNGDIAEITHASKSKFIVRVKDEKGGANDNSKIIEFDPSAYYGFRHGYATTIFQTQGASIMEVFMYHCGFAGLKNAYVGLSRNIKNLKLYINREVTNSFEHLIKQMSQDPEISSSLAYKTREDIEKEVKELSSRFERNENNFFNRILSQASSYAKGKFTEITDKYSIDQEYYSFKPDSVGRERVEEVFELFDVVEDEISAELAEERGLAKAAGGEGSSILEARSSKVVAKPSTTTRSKSSLVPRGVQTPKQRFYSKVDYAKLKEERMVERKEVWNRENEQLKHRVKIRAEDIATKFLGEVNRKMSYGDCLRFGASGKIAVRVTDGSWHDFSSGEGGDMFKLVQRELGCDFKGAEEHLRDYLGLPRETAKKTTHLRLVDNLNPLGDHKLEAKIKAASEAKRQQEKEDKIGKAIKLHARSKSLHEASVGFGYLSKTRCIDASVIRSTSEDIRTAGIMIGETSKGNPVYAPGLIAFARNDKGEITGGQHIVLDKKTNSKAKVEVPKKSFGVISGSFVEVFNADTHEQDSSREAESITIIAEGLETALSVVQGTKSLATEHQTQIKVLCSLGISNIRNYSAKEGERIIIAADNDGKESRTDVAINTAAEALKEKGAFVEIARPSGEEKGDFNDMLQQGKSAETTEIFRAPIEKHLAKTLKDYFGAGKLESEKTESLAKSLPANGELQLAKLQEYGISQESIVEAFRKSERAGKSQLHHMWKSVGFAEHAYRTNKEIFEIAAGAGASIEKDEAVRGLIDPDQEKFEGGAARRKSGELVLAKIEEKKRETEEQFNLYTRKYIQSRLAEFSKAKEEAKDIVKLLEAIKEETKYLSSLGNNKLILLDGNVISKALKAREPETNTALEAIEKSLIAHKKHGIVPDEELSKQLCNPDNSLKTLAKNLQQQAERNCYSHLMPMHIELSELEKLGCKLDKDEIVGRFKNMTRDEKSKWGNDRLAEETRKYVTPLLARHQEAKDKAPNFTEFMKAIEAEHKTLSRLGENHQLALSALDKKNGGGLKLSILASYAKKLDIGLVKESIDYALKHELTKPELIRSQLSKPGVGVSNLYHTLRAECKFHKTKMEESQVQKPAKEQVKQQTKQLEKDFDGPCL